MAGLGKYCMSGYGRIGVYRVNSILYEDVIIPQNKGHTSQRKPTLSTKGYNNRTRRCKMSHIHQVRRYNNDLTRA